MFSFKVSCTCLEIFRSVYSIVFSFKVLCFRLKIFPLVANVVCILHFWASIALSK